MSLKTDPLARPRANGSNQSAVAIAAIVLTAINLRPAIASVGPLLGDIRSAFGLSNAAAGLLTTVPALCMGVFAPLAPVLSRRFGADRAVIGALALIAGTMSARATASSGLILIASTVGVGLAIAIAGALIGPFVKTRFPDHAARVIGVYAASLSAGATLAALVSAPVSATFGSWRAGLGIWALLPILPAALWIIIGRSPTPHGPLPSIRDASLWRETRAWKVALFFGLQNALFYSIIAWLAPLLVERGATPQAAGAALSVITGTFLVGNLLVGAASGRSTDRRVLLLLSSALCLIGVLGVATAVVISASTSAAALGLAGAFTLGMTLPLDDADSADSAGLRTTFTLTVGYTLGSAGPLLVGIIRDLSGSLHGGLVLLTALALAMFVLALALGPSSQVGTRQDVRS